MNLERFLVGKRRDSNPQGCGAEETRRRPKPIRTKSALHLLKYQPNSEKRAAFYNVPCGPDGPGIKFVASSARKEGHMTSMFWT